MAAKEETTPLISRHQRASQQYQQQQNHHEEEYEPSENDFDKEDRRSIIGRLQATMSSMFSSTAGVPADGNFDEDYYNDTYNDYSWKCSFGTKEEDGIWMNRNDQAGIVMAFFVWLLSIYSGVTVTLLSYHNHLPGVLAMIYCSICALALASHAKTTFTDPGSIPQTAVPRTSVRSNTLHAMCTHCQTYKPPMCHHCRICNRCISRMDHHCPWINNCVGAGNMKHFILFLCYTWIGAALALLIFGCNYFLCITESCTLNLVLIQLVRAMTVICLGGLMFTSSLLMTVVHGVMTGIGTIDRLKMKANNTLVLSKDESIPLEDIFGIQGYHTWWLPIDPVFEDYDKVMGYATPQRLLREQQRNKKDYHSDVDDSQDYSNI